MGQNVAGCGRIRQDRTELDEMSQIETECYRKIQIEIEFVGI